MSQSPHAIRLQNLSVIYDNAHQALHQLNCTFEAGSFTALVGPSGCGKSTLLRCLAGLIAPSDGTVTASDDIGFVFQEPTFLAWRSVYENVALPMKIAGLSKQDIDQRVSRALDMVGLQSRHAALPRQLSGGMKMRVSLARALAERPQLLLLDEPFAALDELTRFRLDDDLRMIWQQENNTIVFVTHSITEAAYLAERVLVMNETGQVIDDLAMPARTPEEDFRASPDYHAACQQISAALGHHAGEPT